jgi:hypothetical protein
MTGTPEENKAVSQGVVAYFGTYTVDEANDVVTLHIEQSSFSNWNGTDQQRRFTFHGRRTALHRSEFDREPGRIGRAGVEAGTLKSVPRSVPNSDREK